MIITPVKNIDPHAAHLSENEIITGSWTFNVGQLTVTGSGNTQIDLVSTGVNSSPTLNLQNDAQAWMLRVAGFDNDKFYIRDVTNNKHPLIIEVGTPENTLYLNSAGRVGIEIATPAEKLDVAGNVKVSGNLTDGTVSRNIAEINSHLAGHSDTVLWSEIDKTVSDLADLATKSHTSLTDKGTNTHPQIDTHIADTSDPHGASLSQTTLNATNLTVASTNGLIFTSASTYIFSRFTDNDTGLFFDISTLEYQFHRDGNIVARIRAVTNQGDIHANRHLISDNGFVAVKDGITAPGGTAGIAKIYVDSADGDLKVVFGDGTVKTLATDT